MESAAGSTDRAEMIKPISAGENPADTAYSGTTTLSMSHTPFEKIPAPKVARASRGELSVCGVIGSYSNLMAELFFFNTNALRIIPDSRSLRLYCEVGA